MMALAYGWDAAYCPNPVPPSISGHETAWCEVYVGGSSATRRHGWGLAELARVNHLPKLPVWVPTPGVDNPRQSALACRAALAAFRVPAYASPWRWVLVDLETGAAKNQADAGWLAVFRGTLEAGGFDTVSYASAGWVCGYPAYSGRLAACWDGDPDLSRCNGELAPCAFAGKQYAAGVQTSGGTVDLDVIGEQYLPHLGLFNATQQLSAEVVADVAPQLLETLAEVRPPLPSSLLSPLPVPDEAQQFVAEPAPMPRPLT
jgi:hypothetical protein